MKLNSRLFPLATALALAGGANATIFTVHNDPLYNAQYDNINDAIDAASPNDTLLVHGSDSYYSGSFTLSIPLTIIGPGLDPDNGPPANFNNTLTVAANADGSRLEGLYFSQILVHAANVHIRACRIQTVINAYDDADQLLVDGCLFINARMVISSEPADVEVRNCYFSKTSLGHQFNGGNGTSLVHYNVFERSMTAALSTNVVFTASNSFAVFADNVFLTATVASFNPQDCPNYVFQNNLSYCPAGALPSLGPNNLDNTAPTWNLASGSPTFDFGDDYNMLSGAPLTGASDGGQVGVMGGSFPLRNDGKPLRIPQVTNTQVLTPYVPLGGTIDVHFEAEQGQP